MSQQTPEQERRKEWVFKGRMNVMGGVDEALFLGRLHLRELPDPNTAGPAGTGLKEGVWAEVIMPAQTLGQPSRAYGQPDLVVYEVRHVEPQVQSEATFHDTRRFEKPSE